MTTLLEGIQGIIGNALPPIMSMSTATIHVYTAGSLTAAPTYVDHVVTNVGFVDSEAISLRQSGALLPTERAILFYVPRLPAALTTTDAATGLISSSLKVDDEVTMAGSRAKLVRQVAEDPAQATQIWAAVDS